MRALEAASQIENQGDRAKALMALAVCLPEPESAKWTEQAWAAAAAAHALADAFPDLAEHLEEPRRTKALHEALAEARAGYRGHKDLAKLAEYLPAPERAAALRDTVSAVMRNDSLTLRHDEALGEIAPYLADLPPEELLPIWRKMLHELAGESRQDQLACLTPLGPVIVALGGEQAAEETFRAILDVGRWWR